MSIASTQMAMGYVAFTTSSHRCPGCKHSTNHPPPVRGLRCGPGGFFVTTTATCNNFDPRDAEPAAPLTHIGPTDI